MLPLRFCIKNAIEPYNSLNNHRTASRLISQLEQHFPLSTGQIMSIIVNAAKEKMEKSLFTDDCESLWLAKFILKTV
jgi:hypothetical protein